MSVLRRKLWLAACAVLIVGGLIFPDIVFFNRTLQPSNILPFMGKPATWHASSALVPVFDSDVLPADGFGDLHSALRQFEPAHYFMARVFRTGNSPWWNPYSASGTLGPETLVDVKFSPHTLLAAGLFNASPASFDWGLLIVYCVGFYFMLRMCMEILQTEWFVAVVAASVYLLNGFAVTNLNTGIGQPYFLYPMVLFSLLTFCQTRSLSSWLLVVVAHAIILLANIMTTLTLTLLAVHVLGVAFYFCQPAWRCYSAIDIFKYFFLIFLAVVFSIVLLGFLWVPVIHSFFITDMATGFEARNLPKPAGFENWLSVFSPRHFWDVFGHVSKVDLYPEAILEKKTQPFPYVGIMASWVAVCAWRGKAKPYALLVLFASVLLVMPYARVFGLAGFIDYVPVLHAIGNQYWSCMAAVVLPVLIALGLQGIRERDAFVWLAGMVLLLQALGVVYLFYRVGTPASGKPMWHVLLLSAWWIFSWLVLLLIKNKMLSGRFLMVLVSLSLLVELFGYMNTVRPIRYGISDVEPGVVTFLRKNIGDARVLNVGQQGVLYPEYGSLFGIHQAGTMVAGLLPWYKNFFDKHFGNDTFFFLALDGSDTKKRKKTARKDYAFDELALDADSIKYILVSRNASQEYFEYLQQKHFPLVYEDSEAQIFENIHYLPSLFLVKSLSTSTVLNPHYAAITGDKALLEKAGALGVAISDSRTDSGTVSGTVSVVSSSNTDLVATVTVSSPAVLVQSDTWHPNWRATVDGELSYVGRVNEAFRGIVLPAGTHEVRIYYDSAALRYGMRISMVGSGLLIVLLLWSWVRQREGI